MVSEACVRSLFLQLARYLSV